MGKSDLIENRCEEMRKNMAVTLGNIWESNLEPTGEGLGLGLGFVRYRRSISGKRIAISSNMEVDSTPTLKKPCLDRTPAAPNKSLLEALPQDILVSTKFMNSYI